MQQSSNDLEIDYNVQVGCMALPSLLISYQPDWTLNQPEDAKIFVLAS
jgi:hypothetical protein